MFSGHIHIPTSKETAERVFLDLAGAAANGFYTSEDGSLIAYKSEDEALAVARVCSSGCGSCSGGCSQCAGGCKCDPTVAVLHIGPIQPAALLDYVEELPGGAIRINPEGTALVGRIVERGSFAWNRVDISLRLFSRR